MREPTCPADYPELVDDQNEYDYHPNGECHYRAASLPDIRRCQTAERQLFERQAIENADPKSTEVEET
jgi:hypothetical protein